MRVSVVICTYNRADGLRDTLESLRRQTYNDFEVVVVNGPSTDHTLDVVAEYLGVIKLASNSKANLSMSRNIGIRAAAGDVIAFIDDDALPESNWLEQAIPAFDDDGVGGVGGIVLDHTGMRLQYRFSAANRLGESSFSDDLPFDDLCVPGAWTFPYLQGTNALFRRSALARVGLFDETFDFYLDETDLCCRIIDAGYQLRQLSNAPVHHKYLPSAVRNHAKVITNWYPVVKNHTYFGYRHALHEKSALEVIDGSRAFVDRLLTDTRSHVELGNLPAGHLLTAINACGDGLADGIRLGREGHGRRIAPAVLDPEPFVQYPTIDMRGRRLVLVSSGYRPNITGGIARFISDVAPELARRGHDVRVMTRSEGDSAIDLESGVWVHRLELPDLGRFDDAPTNIDRFATAVADEIQRIAPWWTAELAYGSLWDVELLGVLRDGTAPVVPMLATPTAEVAVHEGWDDPAAPNHDQVRSIVALEREVVAEATAVHAISDAIVKTFDSLYPGARVPERTLVAHIGRSDDRPTNRPPMPDMPPVVLFVGRLEPRKGIDVFLDAVALLVNEVPDVRFIVAGDDRRVGPSGLSYPEWWRLARPDEDRVTFTGPVDDAQLDALMDNATVVTMPSRYESFGLVVVEAMMHERAAVASAVGGIVELIEDGVTGRVVPVGDSRALASAIAELVTQPAAAAAMGVRAREHFEKHLSTPSAVDRLETVIERAIALANVP